MNVTHLPVVCVREDVDDEHLASHLFRDRAYVVLGTLCLTGDRWTPDGNINRWLVHDVKTGSTLPGMWHPDIFRQVTTDDSFF